MDRTMLLSPPPRAHAQGAGEIAASSRRPSGAPVRAGVPGVAPRVRRPAEGGCWGAESPSSILRARRPRRLDQAGPAAASRRSCASPVAAAPLPVSFS